MTLVSDAEIKRLLLALSSWFQLDYEVVDVCVPEVLDRVCNRWIPIRLPRLMLVAQVATAALKQIAAAIMGITVIIRPVITILLLLGVCCIDVI